MVWAHREGSTPLPVAADTHPGPWPSRRSLAGSRGACYWVVDVCAGGRPVFVGFNAPFDWMFVADYFHRFTGSNPFGYTALDLKALFMGRGGVARWADTTMGKVLARHPVDSPHTHHALDDARMQAAIARRLLDLSEPPRA